LSSNLQTSFSLGFRVGSWKRFPSQTMDETSDLLNLPDDCLFLILSPQPGGSRNGLQPGDVATVGLTCKRLSDFVKRDNLWAEYCQHWLDSNHHAWEIPPELGGERLQARQLLLSLMLPSFRSLMAGLHKLGGSPVGLWHPTKDQTQGKCEGLLFVSATEPSSRSSAGFGNIPYPHLVGSLVEWNETPDGMSFKPEHKTFFSVVLGSEAPAAAAEQVEFPLVLPSLSLMGRLKHATAASFQAMAPPAISTPTATTGATPPHPAAAPTGPLSIGCEASHPRAASRPGSNEIAQQSLSQEWGTDVSAQWPSAVPAQFAASRTGQSHD